MVKKIIISILILFSLLGCGQKFYKIERDQYGEPILNDKSQYTFKEKPKENDLKKIDTSAYYVQVFEGRYYNEDEIKNPRVYIFHNDGFFKIGSILYFGNFDKHRGKNSVYYGGRYRIEKNKIFLENFSPISGDFTKYYKRKITEGKIDGNRIVFKGKNITNIYEKRKTLTVKE